MKKLARLDDDEYRKELFSKETPSVSIFPSIEYVYKKVYLKESTNNTTEEIEYVLVKEPKLNRYRKRWNGHRKMSDCNKGILNNNQEDYSYKRKMTYEINENEQNINSHSTNDTTSLNKSLEKRNIFMKKEKSRFNFVIDDNNTELKSSKVDIPDSFYDYVNRKTTLLFVLNSLQEKESMNKSFFS